MINPGMWQYYIMLPENKGLSVENLRRRFLAETIRYEEYLAESMLQNSIADNNNGAGGGNAFIEVSAAPPVSVTPSISITPSISVTPSISTTPSISVTPSISRTPSISTTPATGSVSPTPSISITPSVSTTPTGSIPPTPSPTPTTITTGSFFSGTVYIDDSRSASCDTGVAQYFKSVTGNGTTFCNSTEFSGSFGNIFSGSYYVSFGGNGSSIPSTNVVIATFNGTGVAVVTEVCSSC